MRKNTIKKTISVCLTACVACAMLAGCSKKAPEKSDTATAESAAEVLDNSKLTQMPDGVSLSEDKMKATMSAYAGYMSEALASDGYSVNVRYDDDGSVHFDGVKTAEDGSTSEVPDLSTFDSLEDAFAYLYNCGQADAEGNLLVSTSVSADQAASEAPAESEAVESDAVESDASSVSEEGDAAESSASEATDSEVESTESEAASEEAVADEAASESAVG